MLIYFLYIYHRPRVQISSGYGPHPFCGDIFLVLATFRLAERTGPLEPFDSLLFTFTLALYPITLYSVTLYPLLDRLAERTWPPSHPVSPNLPGHL